MFFTDEPQLALGAACLLSSANEFEVLKAPAAIVELLPAVSQEQPDVLLLDLNPEITLALVSLLHQAVPECRIVLWTRTIADELAQQVREVGVAGIVRRTCGNEEFIARLRSIVAGADVFEAPTPKRGTKVRLTRRESQIVALLGQGLKNKEIAACLDLTEGTIKGYLVHLFQKVGARDRFELALLGMKNTYCGQAFWDGSNGSVTQPEESRARPVLRSLVLVDPVRREGYPERAAGA